MKLYTRDGLEEIFAWGDYRFTTVYTITSRGFVFHYCK